MNGTKVSQIHIWLGSLLYMVLLGLAWFPAVAAPHAVNRHTLLLWRFDEGVGTNVTDASSFGRTGHFSPDLAADGSAAWTTGDNGFSNAIHYGAAASGKFRKVSWSGEDIGLTSLDAFSVQMRIRPTHFTKEDRFWALGGSLGSTCQMCVDPAASGILSSLSELSVYWYSSGHRRQAIVLTEPLTAGVWQELTLVHRAQTATNALNQAWQIWRDGRLIGSSTSDYEVTFQPRQVYVGSAEDYSWNYNYEGDFDEFRIQGEAVYGVPDPACQPFQADDNTLLLWRFDEGAGTNVTDSSGNGRHGAFTPHLAADGPLVWETSAPGFGNALYREGVHSASNRCVQWSGADMQLASLDAFSVQIRIKPKHFTGGDYFWAIGTSLGSCVALQEDYYLTSATSSITNVNIYHWSNAAHRNIPVTLTEPLEAGIWQELTLIHRKAGTRSTINPAWQIWKDGRLIGESTADYPVGNPSAKVYVTGAEDPVWYRYFEGAVDEFRIQGEAVYSVIPPANTILLIR